MQSLVPQISGLELLEEVGRGARNAVYRGRRRSRMVAVKVPRNQESGSLEDFQREASLQARVQGAGLPEVYEVGAHEGTPYLISEFVEGESLAARLKRGPLQGEEALSLAAELAETLAAIHDSGLVHRDLKPGNVLFTPTGRSRLIDFGLATRSLLDQGGGVTGTFRYSAPEQTGMLDRPLDGRADLYALGVVLFEGLSGRAPFHSEDPAELIRLHAVAPVPPLGCAAPAPLLSALPRLLAKDPDDRFRSARELLEHLGYPVTSVASRPLAGRQAELQQLHNRWEEARAGRGNMVLIVGEGGSGKSQLCTSFAEQAGIPLLSGKCDPALRPFGLLHELLARLQPKHRQAVRACAGPYQSLLAGFSPVLASLLEAPPEEAEPSHYLQVLSEFLLSLARMHPVAVMLDDLQWVDGSSLQLLKRVLRGLADTGCLLLATSRLAELADVEVDRLVLQPLSADDISNLLHSRLGPNCDPGMATQLMLASNGSPFVAVETLEAALDAGLFVPHWGGWRSLGEGLTRLELPGHVVNAVVYRLDHLQPAQRRILQTAAVIGLRFNPELLQRMAGKEAHRVLAEGSRLKLLEKLEGPDFRFVHDRIRETLLGELSEAELRQLHRDIAAVLPEQQLFARAEHSWSGREGPSPEVAELCHQAGHAALAQHADVEAHQYFTRALESGLPGSARFHEGFGDAACRLGIVETAVQHYGEARLTDSRPGLCYKMASAYILELDTEKAWPLLLEGLKLLGAPLCPNLPSRLLYLGRHGVRLLSGSVDPQSLGEVTEQASRLYLLAAQVSSFDARIPELVEFLTRGTRAAASLPPSPTLAILFGFHTIFLSAIGVGRVANKMAERADGVAARLNDPMLSAQCETYQALALRTGGNDVQAQARMAEVLSRRGNWVPTFEYLLGLLDLCHNLHFRGLLAEAHSWVEAGARRVRSERFPILVTCSLSAVYAAVGRPNEARKYMQIGKAGCQSSGSPIRRSAYLVSTLHACLEFGELGSHCEELIEAFHSEGYTPLTTPFHPRCFYILEAYVRMRQCQTGVDPLKRKKYAQALRRLRLTGHIPLFKTHLALLDAGYQRLLGRTKRCRALLVQALDLAHRYDNAWVRLEVARQYAYLLRHEGLPVPAAREAALALAIARENGWTSQVYALEREFSLDSQAGSVATRGGASQSALLVRLQRNLEALLQVTTAAASVLDTGKLSQLALQELVRILGAERAFLFLTEEDELRFETGLDASGKLLAQPTDYATSVVRTVTQTGRTVLWSGGEEGRLDESQSVRRHELRSILAAPLSVRDRLLGVVYLDSRLARGVFGQDDVQLLHALSHQIAVTLETARAGQLEVQIRSEREQRLLAEQLGELVGSLLQHMDAAQLLERLLDGLARVVSYDSAFTLFIQSSRMHNGPCRGCEQPPPGDWAAVLESHRPLQDGPRLCAALRTHEEMLGVVGLERTQPFTRGEIEMLHTFAGYASMALENARLFNDVERLATTDELTGLHNRRHFFRQAEDELRRADRMGHEICVVMFDIDHFKKFNDNYGHATGDAVLTVAAARCRNCLRSIDIIGRYGGEEFAIVLVGTGLEPGIQTAERLRACMADELFSTPQGDLAVHISLGIAERRPKETFEAALERADTALYESKRAGRNRVTAG